MQVFLMAMNPNLISAPTGCSGKSVPAHRANRPGPLNEMVSVHAYRAIGMIERWVRRSHRGGPEMKSHD